MPAARKKLNRFFCASVSEDADLPDDVEALRCFCSSTDGRADETALVLTLVADFLDAAYAMASWSWGSEPSNSRRVILGASRPNIFVDLEGCLWRRLLKMRV